MLCCALAVESDVQPNSDRLLSSKAEASKFETKARRGHGKFWPMSRWLQRRRQRY